MLQRTAYAIICLFFLLVVSTANGQTSLKNQHPDAVFREAHDLFHKERYAAARDRFMDYCEQSDNHLMESEANYYIALCSAELLLTDTELRFEQFRASYPENTRVDHSYYVLGSYFFQNKRYRDALWEFIEIDPYILLPEESIEYHFMTGYGQFKEGNLSEAKAYFHTILEVQHEYYHLANYFHAYICFEQEDYELALRGFKRIVEHPNFSSFVPVYIMEVYALMGDYNQVIDYGEKLLEEEELQKKHVVELLLAQAYFQKADYKSSAAFYEKYTRDRSLGLEDRYQYGFASYSLKDYKNAVTQFEEFIIEEDSFGQNVAYHLADAYLKTGKKLEARNSFQFAKRLNFLPDIKENAAYQFAKLSYELGFSKAGINSFQQFIKDYPKSKYLDEAREQLTRMLLKSNDYRLAFKVVSEMDNPSKKINGAYQRLAYIIGLQYFEVKQYEEARRYLNLSLERPVLEVFKALSHFWIAESLYRQERYDEALKGYKNFLFIPDAKHTPLYGLAHYNIAYCYIKDENYKDALYHFEEYEKLDNALYEKQFDADTDLRMADCYFMLKVYDKALKAYQNVLDRKFSDMDYALFQMGMIHGLQNNQAEKIRLLSTLTRSYPESGFVDDALFQIANEHFLLGNKKQALREFEYLNQDYKNNIYYKYALLKIGLIYYQLGNPDKATQAFNTVVAEFPSSPESMEALRAIKDIYVDLGEVQKYFAMLDTLGNVDYTQSAKDSALFSSALSFLKRKDCGKAINAFNNYLEEFPNGFFAVQANYYKADCEYKQGNWQAALSSFDEVIRRKPNAQYERSLEKAAAICFEQESFALAIPYLKMQEDITNEKGKLVQVYEALAKAYLETGDCDKASNYLNKIKRFDNADPRVLQKADYTLARCALNAGDSLKALELFQEIANDNTGKLGAESLYLVAYIYYSLDMTDSSKSAILSLKNNFPGYDYFVAKGFILMADNYTKLGDYFNAKAILQSIIENYEGEDLVELAKEKIEKILVLEGEKAKKIDEIQENQEDSIEYKEN